MITDLWVQILGVRSEKGYEKSYNLVWNRVRVLRTVRHTPNQHFGEYPPSPPVGGGVGGGGVGGGGREGGQCLILIMDQHARRKRKEGQGKDSQLTSDCYVVWIASDAATAHASTAASPFVCNLSNAHSIFICIAFCVNLVKKWKKNYLALFY